ncbi:MAG: PEP-CTERM sorting domain-containing protein [Pirellulales bacterium]
MYQLPCLHPLFGCTSNVRRCATILVLLASLLMLVTSVATANPAVPSVWQYNGIPGNAAVDSRFAAATANHRKEYIDFDNDGFLFGSKGWTPIPPNQYAAQGVTLLNLDARDFSGTTWTHSLPVGAWHTGFPQDITTPYSFVFLQPVASFGMFADDLEGPLGVTVSLTTGSRTFTIPRQDSDLTQFYGFVADSNAIQRLDFSTFDYHVVDSIQFGRAPVPEPGTMALAIFGGMSLLAYVWLRRRAG